MKAELVPVPTRPREWVFRAACAGVDPQVFFPENADGALDYGDDRIAEARRYCDACPVATDCLFDAMSVKAHGIWSGTTHGERSAWRAWDRRVAS